MELQYFVDNWPIIIVALGVVIVFLGLVRRLVKLAFLGVALGVIALFIWPLVAS